MLKETTPPTLGRMSINLIRGRLPEYMLKETTPQTLGRMSIKKKQHLRL